MRLRLALLFLLWLAIPASAQVVTTRDFPQGAQVLPVTFGSTGTTGQITATLTGVAGKFSYLCGFTLSSGGTTTQLTVSATVTGLIGGTRTWAYVYPSSGQGLLGIAFPGCISSSAVNTSITITLPAGGAGTTVNSIVGWGYTN